MSGDARNKNFRFILYPLLKIIKHRRLTVSEPVRFSLTKLKTVELTSSSGPYHKAEGSVNEGLDS